MVKKSRKLAMVKRESEKELSVTFTKRRQGLFNKAAEFSMLCDSQIAVLVGARNKNKKPKKVKIYTFGHTSVPNVIVAFLHNSLPSNNVADHEIKHCSVSVWNQINSAETLTGRGDQSKNDSTLLKKLDDFENCESVEELKKLVEGLEKLVDQVKRNPNFNNSDNCDDLLDLQDSDYCFDSSNCDNNGDHQLLEILELELKNCEEMKKSECAGAVPELKVINKELSFDNEYEDTHIPFVDYWPSP